MLLNRFEMLVILFEMLVSPVTEHQTHPTERNCTEKGGTQCAAQRKKLHLCHGLDDPFNGGGRAEPREEQAIVCDGHRRLNAVIHTGHDLLLVHHTSAAVDHHIILLKLFLREFPAKRMVYLHATRAV
mmetsp:Transcript_19813/g.32488  ORF Transcript_19813/g.32488 Transcript_19813/m.32488 type:complete len:128 (+) Transcript_19813:633-1016(+)